MLQAVVDLLKADSGVGAIASDRIRPGRRLQGEALPSIVVNVISGEPVDTDDGPSGADPDVLIDGRLQVDCWADTYAGARNLASAVRAALRGYSTADTGTGLHFAFLDDERDFNEAGSGQPDYPFRTSLEFNVWHTGD